MISINCIILEDGDVVAVRKKYDRIFGYHEDAKTNIDNLAYAKAAEFINEEQHTTLINILANDPNNFNKRFAFKPLSTLVENLNDY